MGRPRQCMRITGEVVPPGSLDQNEYNRFARMTPTRRWEGIVRACAAIVEARSLIDAALVSDVVQPAKDLDNSC